MHYTVYDQAREPLILEQEDWTEQEWTTILNLFGQKEAERIVVKDYALEVYGTPECNISEDQWEEAEKYLNTMIVEYAAIGLVGRFALDGVLIPLKKRFDNGERTKELYDAIMEVE